MKKLLVVLTLFIAVSVTSYSQKTSKPQCTLTCNLTTSYVCPNSNTWKNNPDIYNDGEMMVSLGYRKDNKGCWQLRGGNTKTIQGSESKLKTWFNKLKRVFSTSKTGF